MSTKDSITELLESCRGTFLSGEEIAEKLDISRTAVWKGVRALKAAGYPIDAVSNKGYRLPAEADILSGDRIKNDLSAENSGMSIRVEESVSSTNTVLKELASKGAPEGSVLIAVDQTGGKGRMGRSFFSPAGTGLYLSLLLRPEKSSGEAATMFTTMAAVAACEAVREVSGRQPGIKWVNDLFLDGKKICGILTEGAFSLEDGFLEYAVLGIGFNVYKPAGGFPDELKSIAGAIFGAPVPDCRSRLAAAFLNHFMRYYRAADRATFTEAYRKNSIALGREITVVAPTGDRRARALDVDDFCHLIVEYEDGTRDTLSSGEIRIKL